MIKCLKLLDRQVKVAMTYKHLSQEERYQIYILMSAGNNLQQIAELLCRHKSTISREITRNTGGRGYLPRQACLLAQERSLGSRNASQITAKRWSETVDYLMISEVLSK